MYYVYILVSQKNRDIYIGYSTDLRKRLRDHNSGFVDATKVNRPWDLIYYEAYQAKLDATKRERQLKNHRAKEDLRMQLKYSLGA